VGGKGTGAIAQSGQKKKKKGENTIRNVGGGGGQGNTRADETSAK